MNFSHSLQSKALWRSYAPDATEEYITRRQLIHVSLISCFSFLGRLLSGIGSDILVKRMHKSRFWCLVGSSSVFTLAQFAGFSISNPNWLWILSSVSGLGYGFLFGVYPALIADAFGVSGLSANWGFMTIAPVIFGDIFNLLYGTIYDAHSKLLPSGERVCGDGLNCYRASYVVTFICAVVGIAGALAAVYRDSSKIKAKREMVPSGRTD
jgi:MFS family permease